MSVNITEIGGQIEIETVYSEASNATGVLYSFLFLEEDVNMTEMINSSKSGALALDKNTSRHYTFSTHLDSGKYTVYAYDIEEDGTLSNGVNYPAVSFGEFYLEDKINPAGCDP